MCEERTGENKRDTPPSIDNLLRKRLTENGIVVGLGYWFRRSSFFLAF